MIQEPPQTRFIELVMPQRPSLHCQGQQSLQTIVQVPPNQSKEAKVFVLTRQQMLKLMSKHTKPKSKITSAPFLSRPPPSTPMVIETEPNTIKAQKVDQPEKIDPSIRERHSRYSNPISTQYRLQDTITTTTSIENNLNWNCSGQPLILTSMADIEMSETNIMASHSIVEESGAMPATVATVEEMNVPVFINECIQELSDGPAKSIQHARTYDINSLNNHNSNNNNNNNHNEDNTTNNGKVDDNGNICELLDIFDFDLEDISENRIDALDKQQLEKEENLKINVDDESNGHQQQPFLNQLMDVFILDGNNNNFDMNINTAEVVITNNTNNSNNNNNNNSIHNHITLSDNKLLTNNNKIMNSSLSHIIQMDDLLQCNDEIFKCLPDSQYDEISIDDISHSQNAIEFNQNELFENCFHQYQSTTRAELSRTVSMAEPLITAENDNEATTISIINNNCYMTMIKKEEFPSSSTDYNTNKRPNKLLLDINEINIKSELDTPVIVDSILSNYSEASNFGKPQSVDTIRKQLEENNSTEYCENSTEFFSDVSTTNQSYTTDYPTSPWSCSTNTDSKAQQKRGRGRPPKNHCDIPDLTKFPNLSEGDKKKMMERCKNNEASRKSRLKNKEQEQRLIQEEKELQKTVNEKKDILRLHRKMEYKLTRALYRLHFSAENMMES